MSLSPCRIDGCGEEFVDSVSRSLHEYRNHGLSKDVDRPSVPDKTGYGRGWSQVRAAVLERDDKTCRICGAVALNVHHIIKKNEFRNPEQSHRLWNLATLCSNCHNKIEQQPVSDQLDALGMTF